MKVADPTVKVGVVVVTGEDSWGNTNHTVVNPRTGQSHQGWTAVLLSRLHDLGVTPYFVIYLRYEQRPGNESDSYLLQATSSWKGDAQNLRQMLQDYLGATEAAKVELVCTEFNSVSYNPGKQSTSLVNGLYLADVMGVMLQTEFNAAVWWDTRNGQDYSKNNAASLYGWRNYGDYGLFNNYSPYPTYYAQKLLSHFARGGDSVVTASSDYPLLTAYAAKRLDGSLTVLVVNKSAATTFNTTIAIAGYTPAATATTLSYGKGEDDAARTGVGSPDLTAGTINNAATSFSQSFAPYSLTVLTFTPNATRVSGTVTLQNAGSPAQPVAFTFRPAVGSPFTINQTLGSDGTFLLPNIPTGVYTLHVKGAQWLAKNVSVDTSAGDVNGVNVSLISGDANNDNSIDNLDLGLLATAYGSISGDSNFDARADFNDDGSVDNLDLGILANNYALNGDN